MYRIVLLREMHVVYEPTDDGRGGRLLSLDTPPSHNFSSPPPPPLPPPPSSRPPATHTFPETEPRMPVQELEMSSGLEQQPIQNS
jgi:hypothetical protein